MIEITRQSDDLNRQVWKFWPNHSLYRTDIILDQYSVETRKTKRHKWSKVTEYDRTSRKGWAKEGHRLVNLDEVPVLPGDVVEEVMARFVATVTVKRGK